jgi:large subunit ribosomal protein L15
MPTPTPPSSSQPTISSAEADTFTHPSLAGLENVTHFARNAVLERSRLAQVATAYGIDKVVRWKPKKSDNLKASGEETVLAHTMYSIIGALALQRGGEVATRTVRERILRPLGLR